MSKIKALFEDITWSALREGEVIIDGTTHEVWGSEQLKEALSESLDDSYESFKLGEMIFYASSIVENCDPIVFDIMMNEYADSLTDNNILVYGYTLEEAVMSADDFVETTHAAYTVKAS